MQTQKDHVEAYQFMMGRMSASLVLGDPSLLEVPARRAWTGFLAGIGITFLIGLGFFLYGLIVHLTAPKPATKPQAAEYSLQVEQHTSERGQSWLS
ncbi:type VII secretion protein EccB [Crossiella sp. CA198]|uniref:type VII secretion protein EccB n=1 Tax=Crossiella sp. CA198 TaxID=3455607 RepID=UPI003F8D7289